MTANKKLLKEYLVLVRAAMEVFWLVPSKIRKSLILLIITQNWQEHSGWMCDDCMAYLDRRLRRTYRITHNAVTHNSTSKLQEPN